MNRVLLSLLFLFMASYFYSQEPFGILQFEYDNAGNQIVRTLEICLTCDDPMFNRKKKPETLATHDLIQSLEHEQISYYPNPVLEQLYIRWQNNDAISVEKIEVYSMTGQLVNIKNNLNSVESLTLDFIHNAQGVYNVILMYNNGDRKVLKVVKK